MSKKFVRNLIHTRLVYTLKEACLLLKPLYALAVVLNYKVLFLTQKRLPPLSVHVHISSLLCRFLLSSFGSTLYSDWLSNVCLRGGHTARSQPMHPLWSLRGASGWFAGWLYPPIPPRKQFPSLSGLRCARYASALAPCTQQFFLFLFFGASLLSRMRGRRC